MRPTFDRRLWILLFIILIQCIHTTNPLDITPTRNVAATNTNKNAEVRPSSSRWIPQRTRGEHQQQQQQLEAQQHQELMTTGDSGGDNDYNSINNIISSNNNNNNNKNNYNKNYHNNNNNNNHNNNKVTTQKCANKNKCFDSKKSSSSLESLGSSPSTSSLGSSPSSSSSSLGSKTSSTSLHSTLLPSLSGTTTTSVVGADENNPKKNNKNHHENKNNKHYIQNLHKNLDKKKTINQTNNNKSNNPHNNNNNKPSQLPSTSDQQSSHMKNPAKKPHNNTNNNKNSNNNNNDDDVSHSHQQLHIAYRQHNKELLELQHRGVDEAIDGEREEVVQEEELEGDNEEEEEEEGEDVVEGGEEEVVEEEKVVEGKRRKDGDEEDDESHRSEFDMARNRRHRHRRRRRQVGEMARNDDDEVFEERERERDMKASTRHHHKEHEEQEEKPEEDMEEDEGEGDDEDDDEERNVERDVGGMKDNNNGHKNNNNNVINNNHNNNNKNQNNIINKNNEINSFTKTAGGSSSSSASPSSGSGESSPSSSTSGATLRSATSSSTSSGSGSSASIHSSSPSSSTFSKSSSSSSSLSSTQSNSDSDDSAASALFGSQELSSSLEDLLASQMPADLLAISFDNESSSSVATFQNLSLASISAAAANLKRTRSTNNEVLQQQLLQQQQHHQAVIQHHEPIIIIDDAEEFDSGTDRERLSLSSSVDDDDKNDDYSSHGDGDGGVLEPRVLPLRPLIPSPYEDGVHAEEMSVVYAEQHSEIRLMCEVDLDIATSIWYKNGLVVHAMDRTSRVTDYRFIKEANGGLTITNVMLEDDGKWQCEAENARAYVENARPVKLVVLDRPKPPYLLIDSRRLDAGNIFVPVKENSELNLACISEGGNPKPTLTWEVLLSPGVDRHAQKVSAEVLELEEIKSDKDKQPYKINSGAKSEARLPAVYRAHHNARILCVMEHPTLKIRQNASLLLDVQYTPSFAISRTPGFGYPLREGIEVSLKCDVDSNPPSTPRWQKDDGDTPVPQTGDGFLNFSSIRREHSGWYKCTSRHLNFQYSSIGYYLSVRYDSVDVTSEPDDQDVSVAAASHNPNKGQLEVQLGGAVTLQCPQGSLGCWSHLDPVTARLRGLGHGLSTPTGQFSLKDVVYQDAGTYKCIGQSPTNKKKLEVLQTVGVSVKGAPTVMARNATPVAYPGSPLHLTVEFCANPPAHAARWLHGDRVFTPGNQYGSTVLAYGVTDLPTPYCKEARLTYVSMHERVPRTFYFIVSSPGGVAEAVFKVNFTMRYRAMSNAIDDEEEELSEPEEIHFPVFGDGAGPRLESSWLWIAALQLLWLWLRSCRWL